MKFVFHSLHSLHDTNQKGFTKFLWAEPAFPIIQYAQQAAGQYTNEIKVLKSPRYVKCKSVPRFLGYGQVSKWPHGHVPSTSYLNYIAWARSCPAM
ncbi:hypothetical protein N7490_004980 [Penicillium lividum]|nr:hypothetical protein N7490_004980 [Penicillium lividum]